MSRLLTLLAVLPLLVLAACGGSGDHNDADIEFAQGMIPHHEQAIEMADFVPAAGASPDVTRLAAQIKAAQAPEIKQMRGWLKDWDENSDDMDDMGDMDMGDGMMSDGDMDALGSSTGATFDRLWLTGMIKHHEGAVTMAKAELEDGKSAQAKALARKIIEDQEAEITTMKGLLQ